MGELNARKFAQELVRRNSSATLGYCDVLQSSVNRQLITKSNNWC